MKKLIFLFAAVALFASCRTTSPTVAVGARITSVTVEGNKVCFTGTLTLKSSIALNQDSLLWAIRNQYLTITHTVDTAGTYNYKFVGCSPEIR